MPTCAGVPVSPAWRSPQSFIRDHQRRDMPRRRIPWAEGMPMRSRWIRRRQRSFAAARLRAIANPPKARSHTEKTLVDQNAGNVAAPDLIGPTTAPPDWQIGVILCPMTGFPVVGLCFLFGPVSCNSPCGVADWHQPHRVEVDRSPAPRGASRPVTARSKAAGIAPRPTARGGSV